MASSRVCAPAPNPCPGRLLHSDAAAVTRSGQPWRSRVDGEGRWLIRPTIVTDLPLTASAYCDEIFGPVCVVNRFESEEEVVGLANDTRYGLNTMLFTENLSRAHRVASRLRAGTVWVNCFFIRDLRTPFGGAGDSGVGARRRQLQPRVLHRAQGHCHADPTLICCLVR
ncbi:aldehyde dehydrogenase family protein [Nocardioides hungaricus]